MAIDKSHSPAWVKVTVWVLVVALIVGFVAIGFSAAIPQLGQLFGGGGTTTSGTPNDTVNTDTLEVINAQYTSQATATEASVTGDPENGALRREMAGIYMDWAFSLYNSTDVNAQAKVAETMAKAVPHWEKALELAPGDKQIMGDLSTSMFYSGQVEEAIALAEKTVKENPDYATVWYNLGIYRQTNGDNAGAREAYTQAVQNATDADTQLKTAAQSALDSLPE